jgi:hypothetical protein
MSKIGQCKNCLFWKAPEPEERPYGHCHRYAPRPINAVYNGNAGWPYTRGTEICGEWEPKDAE